MARAVQQDGIYVGQSKTEPTSKNNSAGMENVHGNASLQHGAPKSNDDGAASSDVESQDDT